MSLPKFKFNSSVLQSLAVMAALVGSSFLLTHCGSSSGTSATPATFTAVYTGLIQPECASCHQPGGSAYSAHVYLDFSTQSNAWSTLYGASVTGLSEVGTCGSAKVVVPYSSATSYILAILPPATNATNFAGISGCNTAPLTTHSSVNLSASDVTNLTGWINAGAPQN